MDRMFSKYFRPMIFILFALLASTKYAHGCLKILSCTPEISALDHDSLNETIEIRCTFREKINPTDVIWQFRYNNEFRSAVDMDGAVMQPFKHEIIQVDNYPGNPYTISVLKVPLLNSSYYTNYKCTSVLGNCFRVVKINLKERALGYTNASSKNVVFSFFSIFIILYNAITFL